MTKKELSQLFSLSKEMGELEEQIRGLDCRLHGLMMGDSVKGSGLEAPYAGKTIKIEGVAPKDRGKWEILRREMDRAGKQLERVKIRRIRQYAKMLCFIQGIEDSETRRILTYRYQEGQTWQQVANKLGGYATADSVRVLHDRFLKK